MRASRVVFVVFVGLAVACGSTGDEAAPSQPGEGAAMDAFCERYRELARAAPAATNREEVAGLSALLDGAPGTVPEEVLTALDVMIDGIRTGVHGSDFVLAIDDLNRACREQGS